MSAYAVYHDIINLLFKELDVVGSHANASHVGKISLPKPCVAKVAIYEIDVD